MADINDELSLLDIAVFLAENWLALVFLPALVAIGAYFWADTSTPIYRAVATIEIPRTGQDGQANSLTVPYRTPIEPMTGVTVEAGNDTITITAEATNPQSAVALATSARTEVTSHFVASYSGELELAESAIARLEALVDPLQSDSDPESAIALAQVLSTVSEYRFRATVLAMAIEAIHAHEDIIAQRTGRSPVLMATLAWLSSGFVLLFLLIAKTGLQSLAETNNEQVQRIKRAFFLSR